MLGCDLLSVAFVEVIDYLDSGQALLASVGLPVCAIICVGVFLDQEPRNAFVVGTSKFQIFKLGQQSDVVCPFAFLSLIHWHPFFSSSLFLFLLFKKEGLLSEKEQQQTK